MLRSDGVHVVDENLRIDRGNHVVAQCWCGRGALKRQGNKPDCLQAAHSTCVVRRNLKVTRMQTRTMLLYPEAVYTVVLTPDCSC